MKRNTHNLPQSHNPKQTHSPESKKVSHNKPKLNIPHLPKKPSPNLHQRRNLDQKFLQNNNVRKNMIDADFLLLFFFFHHTAIDATLSTSFPTSTRAFTSEIWEGDGRDIRFSGWEADSTC